mgnify:CR=1 FL=1
MGWWTWLCGADDFGSTHAFPTINPATGLPMIGDSTAGVDVGGHLYGEGSLGGCGGLGGSCGLGDIGGTSDPFGGCGGSGFGE